MNKFASRVLRLNRTEEIIRRCFGGAWTYAEGSAAESKKGGFVRPFHHCPKYFPLLKKIRGGTYVPYFS